MFGTFALLGFAPFGSFIGELVMMGGIIASGQTAPFATASSPLLCVRRHRPDHVPDDLERRQTRGRAPRRADDRPRPQDIFFLFVLLTLGIYMPAPLDELLAQITTTFGGSR